MYEICVQQMRDFIALARTGVRPQRLGNSDPAVFWQDVLPAAGTDRWVAITAFDEADYKRLIRITGEDIAAWTAARSDIGVAELLQQAGIAAGALQDCEDLMDHDPQIATRGALITLDHPLLGPFGHVATPIRFSRDVPAPFRAPGMGEHAHQVAAEICGLDAATIAALEDQGVFR
jgi:crotonobetainyl-CoA:carnitine CoA-transferase CaiB-like acyl-CoA transferase